MDTGKKDFHYIGYGFDPLSAGRKPCWNCRSLYFATW